MRIAISSTSGLFYVAGTPGVSEREHASVVDFIIDPQALKQVNERVRSASAGAEDRGNLATTITFSTRRLFGSHDAAAAFCADQAAGEPREGIVVFKTALGTRHLLDAVVEPPVHSIDGCTVYMAYRAAGSDVIAPVPDVVIGYTAGSGITVSAGGSTPLPTELATARGDGLVYRIVDDGSQKWWEVGFLSPSNTLLGDAANGWTDPGGNLLFRFFRSENLTSWDNDFIPAPSTPVSMGDGDWMYYARLKYPIDSAVKSGFISLRSGPFLTGLPGDISGDTRNNPFTALTIAGVAQALGGFPYTMPGDAARMQTDIRALGWTGATVTATSDIVWEIVIPGISQTSYSQTSKLSWPQYLVADMFGVINTPIDGVNFSGAFVNAAGVRTAVSKQFARLGISAGPNNIY